MHPWIRQRSSTLNSVALRGQFCARSFFFMGNLDLTHRDLKNSSVEPMWEDFPLQPKTFTSSHLHSYMLAAAPSTVSRGPASSRKQARRAGKPLNLSSLIVCTLVDGWHGAPLWRAAVKALRRLRNGPQRTGGIHQMWPDVEATLSCMFEDERSEDGSGGGAEGTEGTATQQLAGLLIGASSFAERKGQGSPEDWRVWGTFHRLYSVIKVHAEPVCAIF